MKRFRFPILASAGFLFVFFYMSACQGQNRLPVSTATIPNSVNSIQTITSKIHEGMNEQLVRSLIGAPQRREEWDDFYPIGTKLKELIYWNIRDDRTHAVIISFRNGTVNGVATHEYKEWALDHSTVKRMIGKTSTDLRRVYGEPMEKYPETINRVLPPGVRHLPQPPGLGIHFIYRDGESGMDFLCDPKGRVRSAESYCIRVRAM